MFAAAAVLALALVSTTFAQPAPLTPPTSNEGADCVITWAPDATGTWKETNIQLMTGDNWNMVPLTTVTTLDTTQGAPTTFTWKCPDVTLNSAVYFYQFSHAEEPDNLIWTTRWAIASATGSTVPAPNAVQPSGETIAWGTGALANGGGKPAPSYIQGQAAQPAGSGTASVPAFLTAASTPAASPTLSRASSASMVRSVSSVSSSSATSTASAAAASNAAGSRHAPYAFGALAAIAGFMALA